MKRSQLAFAAILAGIAACREIATAPESSSVNLEVRAARISRSNPPPPPIDTGASVSISLEISTNRMIDPISFGKSFLSKGIPDAEVGVPGTVDPFSVRSSIVSTGLGSETVGPVAAVHTTVVVVLPFTLPVTYNRDEHAPTGFLLFRPDPHHQVTTDPHAEIIQDPHHPGHFAGTGDVHIPTGAGMVDLHLSTVISSGTVFEGCGPSSGLHPEHCFGMKLGSASINGHHAGTVTILPACFPRFENHYCAVVPSAHH